MRILLFGGSFDPPHLGHEALLKAAVRELEPDLAYLVPAHQSPLKSGHHASPAQRLRLVRLMRQGLPAEVRHRVRIHLSELRSRRPSFTYETLRYFRSRHPGAELWFLLGSDALATLPRWNRPAELRTACRWLVGRRPGARMPSGGLPPHRVLHGSFPPVSSRGIRRRLLAGLETESLLSRPVLAEIRRRGLYGLHAHRTLRRTLSSQRYEHTVEVARLAISLAERHGLDAEAAGTAALLHDAGRRFDPAGMVRYARRRRLRVPRMKELVENAPMLLHAFISEDLARGEFGVKDPKVLSAIRNHTFGAPRMAELDRLLYVADISSKDRSFSEAARIRGLAERDLRAAFALAVKTKLSHAKKSGLWLRKR